METVIIDCNATCHRVKHTLGELNHDTMRVGIIFGFFLQMFKIAKDHKTHKFVFVWDSKKSNRTKLYPQYKEARRTLSETKTPQELEEDALAFEQFGKLYERIIPELGYQNNFKYDGFEGDDLMASIVDENPDDFLIVSGDSDLYQLLDNGVTILNNKGRFTIKDFENEYGISPLLWNRVKALAGCKSDGVPGIKGIGEIKAIQYLKEQLTPNMKSYKDITSASGKEIYNRNLPLVTLPLKDTPIIKLKPNDKISLDAFMDVCNRLDFQYFLRKEMLDKAKVLLNMK